MLENCFSNFKTKLFNYFGESSVILLCYCLPLQGLKENKQCTIAKIYIRNSNMESIFCIKHIIKSLSYLFIYVMYNKDIKKCHVSKFLKTSILIQEVFLYLIRTTGRFHKTFSLKQLWYANKVHTILPQIFYGIFKLFHFGKMLRNFTIMAVVQDFFLLNINFLIINSGAGFLKKIRSGRTLA